MSPMVLEKQLLSHAPILQNNIILFQFIPRHYVKFYVKVVIDDSTESRMLNVIMNIFNYK